MLNNRMDAVNTNMLTDKDKNFVPKVKYNILKNTSYAICGLKDIINNERSFQLELIAVAILLPCIFIIKTNFSNKVILFLTLMLVLIAEIINSAIERVVDLITSEHNNLAGKAKDAGSTIVLISIITCSIVWLNIIIYSFAV